MQGVQLIGFVPHEPAPNPVPKIPRPPGFFDHVTFANTSASDVASVTFTLSGPAGTQPITLQGLGKGSFAMDTANLDNGQYHYVAIDVQIQGGPLLKLPTFEIVNKAQNYLGRLQAGLATDPGGGALSPYCVVYAFNQNAGSNDLEVQVVPHGKWT